MQTDLPTRWTWARRSSQPVEYKATFNDGETAANQAAVLRPDLVAGVLRIFGADGLEIRTWAFSDLRELPDHGHRNAIVLTKEGSEERLLVRGRTAMSDLSSLAPKLRKKQVDRGQLGRVWRWAFGTVVAMALLLFVIIPGLADNLARYVPPDREVAFGRTFVKHMTNLLVDEHIEKKVCVSGQTQHALNDFANSIAADLELEYPIEVSVLNISLVNAFAMPGGQVVVTRGLIDEAQNGEEVAAVVAHEVGHVVNKDPTRIALRAAGSAGLLSMFLGDFAGGGLIAVLSEQLLNAGYTRDAETAADAFAHQAMAQKGLSPHALSDFFERLQESYGDADGVVAAFMSHPRFADRIAAADAAHGGDLEGEAFTADEWANLRSICS